MASASQGITSPIIPCHYCAAATGVDTDLAGSQASCPHREILDLFDRMVANVAVSTHIRSKAQLELKLSAFLPIRGRLASTPPELMLFGRAPNGWSDAWNREDGSTEEGRRKVRELAIGAASTANSCPMSWVLSSWRERGNICCKCKAPFDRATKKCPICKTDHYNTARSALWNVACEVLERFGITREWPSHLVWSNLYRISPDGGRNPTSGMRKAQLQDDLAKEMVAAEIGYWQPKRILFLTGDWADAFFPQLSKLDGVKPSVSYGSLPLPAGGAAAIVVAPHPERKARKPIVDAIDEAFRRM